MKTVQWIHPSYRDLVVEELAREKSLRTRFLEVADLEGVKLAVSQAGGRQGERQLPLMVSDDDWKILSRRCSELIKVAGTSTTVSLLEVLRSATVDLEGDTRGRLIDILARCCDAARRKWDEGQRVIRESDLRQLFEASVLIDPLPVAPKLGPTWRSAVAAFRKDLKESIEKSIALDADIVLEWALLADLLMNNEPRFMRQVNFPAAFVGDVEQLLATIEVEAGDEMAPEEMDDIWGEADRMSTLERALTALAKALPRSRKKISKLRSKVSSREDYLRESYRESSPDDSSDYDDDRSSEERAANFDLEALFSDL